MKTLPLKCQTVDAQGRVVDEQNKAAMLMPPRKDACQTCGRHPGHEPDQPHDAQSLYYQYAFYGEHGRWPTWKDAVAHCSGAVKAQWETTLRSMGKWTEPEAVQ